MPYNSHNVIRNEDINVYDVDEPLVYGAGTPVYIYVDVDTAVHGIIANITRFSARTSYYLKYRD